MGGDLPPTLKRGKIVCGNTKIYARPASGVVELAKITDIPTSIPYATTAGNANAVYGYNSMTALKNAMGIKPITHAFSILLSEITPNVNPTASGVIFAGSAKNFGAAVSSISFTLSEYASSVEYTNAAYAYSPGVYTITPGQTLLLSRHAAGEINIAIYLQTTASSVWIVAKNEKSFVYTTNITKLNFSFVGTE